MDYIDLHVHSTASDGSFTPSELVNYAVQKGLKAFALTDHDTTCGLKEAIEAASHTNVECIPGLEFSTDRDGKEVHIVGLYLDYTNQAFIDEISQFLDSRDVRNEKMCQNFRNIGLDITVKALEEEYPNSVITRAHFGRYMVEHGMVANRNEAFDKYLGDHTKYYVNRERISPESAIATIHRYGGVAVFAHPILCHLPDQKLDGLVAFLKRYGLDGIETLYTTYSPSERRQVEALAKKYDLIPSGGSDFHGVNKKDTDLGSGRGNLEIPYSMLEKIKKRHTQNSLKYRS